MKFTAVLLLIAASLLQASPLDAPATTSTLKATFTQASGTSPASAASATSAGQSWLCRPDGCVPNGCLKAQKGEPADSLLPRGAPTLEPASKTEKGLNDWTKDVWPAATTLDIMGGGAGETPTSHLIQWKSSGLQFAAVAGLYGCASAVVVSSCGVYMSHHWGNVVGDEVMKTARFMWDNEFTNPIQGLGKVTGVSKAELDAAYITQKELDGLYPSSGWISLKDASKCFTADKKPQAIIVVHDDQGAYAKHVEAGKEMAKIVHKMVPALSKEPEVVRYANGATDPRQQSESSSDYHGKVIASYDPSKPQYQVWMAGVKLTAPILKGPL